MSAEPLSREERECLFDTHALNPKDGICPLCRLEKNLQAAEERAERFRAVLEAYDDDNLRPAAWATMRRDALAADDDARGEG